MFLAIKRKTNDKDVWKLGFLGILGITIENKGLMGFVGLREKKNKK